MLDVAAGAAVASRVVPREQLRDQLADEGSPIVVLGSIELPQDVAERRVRLQVSPAVALAELAAAGELATREIGRLAPDYAVPPDAVLPARRRRRETSGPVRLGVEHLSAIETLEKDCFARPWGRSHLEPELTGDVTRVVLGSMDEAGRLAGYLLAHASGDELAVVRLAVARAQRRQGVGRSLLRGLIAEGRGQGHHRVAVDVGVENRPARALYAAEGFVEVGRRDAYYADGEDALLLSLFLRRP